jgi:hypothetical protein
MLPIEFVTKIAFILQAFIDYITLDFIIIINITLKLVLTYFTLPNNLVKKTQIVWHIYILSLNQWWLNLFKILF